METHALMVLSTIATKVQTAAFGVFSGFAAVAVTVLFESLPFILIAYGMIALHVASGFLVSWKFNKPWDGEKWFKNGMKIIWFPVGIMATSWMEQTFEVGFSITTMAAAYLAFHDFHGFWSNFATLTGIDIWTAVFEQIDWKKFTKKDPKK